MSVVTVEVLCVSSATHVAFMPQTQNKVLGIGVLIVLFFETLCNTIGHRLEEHD